MGDLRIENFKQVLPDESGKVKKQGPDDFGNVIKGAINRVDKLDKAADRSILDLLQGKAAIHESMIALQKADFSMKLLLSIRNKVIEAYREIMQMPF